MTLLCSLVGHRRSASRATRNFDTERWESVCKGCGAPMVRTNPGEWRLKSEDEQPNEAELV